MTSMTIRHIGIGLEARLRASAAAHGRSMEDEARDILQVALSIEPSYPRDFAAAIRARMAGTGGVELMLAPREPIRAPVDLDP